MILFFQAFVFFVLYVLFGLEYLFDPIGATQHEFYGSVLKMTYPNETIIKVVFFNFFNFLFLLVGFYIGSKNGNKLPTKQFIQPNPIIVKILINTTISLLTIILLYGIITNGFKYTPLVNYRHNYNFIFEMRIIPNLLIAYFIMIGGRFSFMQKILLFVYFLLLVSFQARSMILEFLGSLIIPILLKRGDKINYYYIGILGLLPFIPNIFIVARYWPMSFSEILSSLFSFEYTLLFNLIVAEVMNSYENAWMLGSSFYSSLFLLLPSFLRNIIGLDQQKHDIYGMILHDAGVFGGGFSLPAELLLNYSWFAILYFLLIGYILGYGRKKILIRLEHSVAVTFIQTSYILFYIAFILSLRNDFGVFIKYIFQLWVIALFLDLFFRRGRL